MVIQIDSREKAKAIKKILEEFDEQGVKYFVSKLWTGDYMNLDNPKVIVDRKQNLTELSSNICQGHDRFRRELIRAQENGIQLIILCEHGHDIKCLEDIIFWDNPRGTKRVKKDGIWQTVETNALKGEVMYKILTTLERKYGVRFEFCTKEETGNRIIEILRDEYDIGRD